MESCFQNSRGILFLTQNSIPSQIINPEEVKEVNFPNFSSKEDKDVF